MSSADAWLSRNVQLFRLPQGEIVNDITAFINEDARLDEVPIERAEGTVLVDQGVTVLATPSANWCVTFAIGE